MSIEISDQTQRRSMLRVTSADPGVLITILDRDFETVEKGTGTVEVNVLPGLYQTRFQAGSSVRGQVVSVDASKPVHEVFQKPIEFAAPAPLRDTRSDYVGHRRAAASLSRSKPVVCGAGGQLLLFARDLDLRARTVPTQGLTLHQPGCEPLHVSRDGRSGGGNETGYPPWAGCNYELDPGTWIVRHSTNSGAAVEFALYVAEGWQTQLFLQRSQSRTGGARRPDLTNASVLLANPDDGFDPASRYQRSAEIARLGLRDRHFAVDPDQLREMLRGKPQSPMLAVYGAHLLVHQPEPDKRLIGRVVRNLHGVIGPHPDVRALDVWLGRDGGTFAEPPMLKSSWSIIIEASGERPELVPPGSISAAVAESVLAGGPWLRWRLPAHGAGTLGATAIDPEMPLGRAIAEVAAALPADPREVYEQAALATATQASMIALAQQAGSRAGRIDDATILGSLRVPRTVAEASVGALLEQLGD